MSTTSNTSQQQQQQSQSAPWAPTQGPLGSIINTVAGQIPPLTTVTKPENKALKALAANASTLPNLGPQVTGAAQGLFGSIPQMLQQNQQTVSNALAPQLSTDFTNPFTNPATQQMLSTINADISKQVNDQFAGAGRDLSGQNTQALARGLSQGEATPLFNEYNSLLGLQQGAAGQLSNSGIGTAGAIGGAYNTGAGLASAIPGLTNMGPMAALEAAQLRKNLPISGAGTATGLLLPIAGLGGQNQSSGSSQGQINPSFWQNFALAGQGLKGLGGLFGN